MCAEGLDTVIGFRAMVNWVVMTFSTLRRQFIVSLVCRVVSKISLQIRLRMEAAKVCSAPESIYRCTYLTQEVNLGFVIATCITTLAGQQLPQACAT